MSPDVEAADSDAQTGDGQLLSGWGGTAPTRARLATPLTDDDARTFLRHAPPRGAVARGLGRSYGDAAQNAGGLVLDATALSGIVDADLERGIVTARAGTSFDELMRWLIPRGWFLITPGTRQITLGGAIASDVHGKGHHADGTFGAHVHSLRLLIPSGEVIDASPERTPDIFWATVGGMGLTGVILDATFDLIPVETRFIRVDEQRVPDLDTMIERMTETDVEYRYSVAWIDCLARGKHLGRGVLGLGNHAFLDELPKHQRATAHTFDPTALAVVPPVVPSGLVNRWTMRAFNGAWYRKSRVNHRGAYQDLGFFFHTLDMVEDWNRMYGNRGLVQYQFVVPFGREDAVRHAIEQLSNAAVASFLAVLKRFGASNPGMLSFPMPGWTLALDMPAGSPGLDRVLDRLDEVVLDAGGRVYLSKDARTRPENLALMYPRLGEWQAVRQQLDPERTIMSDLARRLGL